MGRRKPRKMRSSIRAASKAQEREILETAGFLEARPELVIPECAGHRTCFARAARHVAKVHAQRDDPRKLGFSSRWFTHPIARAYAALLLIRREEEIPYLANARTPYGLVAFAMRGRARRNHLIGLEYWNEPRLRLYLVLDHAKRDRATVYAFADRLVCCGRDASPPPDAFVRETTERLGLKPVAAGVYGAGNPDEARLVLRWIPAGVELHIGESAPEDRNTFAAIAERIASPRIKDHFEPRVELPPLRQAGTGALPQEPGLADDDGERYLRGELKDHEIIERQRARRLEALRTYDKTIYVAGETSYGDDEDAFLAALGCSGLERAALEAGLRRRSGPMILDKPSAARALAELWGEHGEAMLTAVTGDEGLARELFASTDLARTGPGAILTRGAELARARSVEAGLPRFTGLPEPVALADRIARAYKGRGKEDAERLVRQSSGGDVPTRGTLHAVELALGQPQSWRYSATEIEIATFLLPHVERLLACTPDEYAGSLQQLSRAAGFTQELRTA